MENFNNDDVKKMLDLLKEQAQSTRSDLSEMDDTQNTENAASSDDEIKDMLKKQFSASESDKFEMSEDYSFDSVDFGRVDEELITGEMEPVELEEADEIAVEIPQTADEVVKEENEEIIEEEVALEMSEEPVEEATEEDIVEEVEEEISEEISENNEYIYEPTIVIDSISEIVEEVLEETDEMVSEVAIEISEGESVIEEEPVERAEVEEAVVPEAEAEAEAEAEEKISDDREYEDPKSEESINYDEVLEGQQGTVFNSFVEDFTGDLDDVVFEAEITESRAPDKQYTIFEDWEQLMKDKQYATAEEGIIPPTKEELAYSAEIAAKAARGNTDYFNPVVTDTQLDAVDIALMVALGGESELNQTVGFEKIRQAVHDVKNAKDSTLDNKSIYGFCGEEYSSIMQNLNIKKKYRNDKLKLILKAIGTLILTVILLGYETAGWAGAEFSGLLSVADNPELHVLAALQILFICAAISFDKIIKLFKNPLGFSSASFMSAMVALVLSVLYDVIILATGHVDAGATVHSIAAFLMLLSLAYDIFDANQQSGIFNIVSSTDKKLVLEPYGKLRMGEDEEHSDIIDKDSYCISRVPNVKKYFARTAAHESSMTSKLISLVLSFSVALVAALVLLLMRESIEVILLGFIITISFSLICASLAETELAFFTVYKILKKYKTGIIGKTSVAEYGKCNIVYFDDFNVFNKKSVRTKGLKLYDNNEIYRILYHAQAVFSKIGGPLKGVFEFATTEMTHSKNVEIKEINDEGICAIVDARTSVLIGTGTFMKNRGIHPSYTASDIKLEEAGEESIMFIALNGVLGAKLYVTYQFSGEFERLARKLSARGVGIGIRSSDPNINIKWAKKYGETKKFEISIVRPTLKEFKPSEKTIEGGIVSTKNVRALIEALMMCIKLDGLENTISKFRIGSIVFIGILSFALALLSGINILSMLILTLAVALCASVVALLTHFYIKH